MKLFCKWIGVLLCCTCWLSGCGAAAEEPLSQIKIGLTLYRKDDTFISIVRNEFEAAAREQESADDIRIALSITDGRSNQSTQNEQVNQFLAQRYHVICVNEVDRTAASVIIDKARAAEIPLVFFNREPVEEDMQRWEHVYYVGSDPKEGGILQGEIVLNLYEAAPEKVDKSGDGKLQYVMLEGEPGHQDAAVRTEYSVKTVTDAGVRVERLATGIANWQRAQGTSKMAQWIAEFGSEIEVVFCNNDEMALGAIEAYKAAGIASLPVIVGLDGTPAAIEAVEDGTLAGTVLNDAAAQGEAIFSLAYALATGKNVQEACPQLNGKYVWVPQNIITKNNA